MLILLSPSKNQNFAHISLTKASSPLFINNAKEIISELKNLSLEEVISLMSISNKLGENTYNNIHNFQVSPSIGFTNQALFSYTGEVFNKINPSSFSLKELAFSQSCIRILSGLYGLLKPLDHIQPYRLEMALKLKIKNNPSLTHYWKQEITQAIKRDEKDIIINLASKEYINAVQKKHLTAKFISIHFKEKKGNKFKVIGIYAKQARGKMVHYIVKNKIEAPDSIKYFDEDGYQFNNEFSSDCDWVFTRN